MADISGDSTSNLKSGAYTDAERAHQREVDEKLKAMSSLEKAALGMLQYRVDLTPESLYKTAGFMGYTFEDCRLCLKNHPEFFPAPDAPSSIYRP